VEGVRPRGWPAGPRGTDDATVAPIPRIYEERLGRNVTPRHVKCHNVTSCNILSLVCVNPSVRPCRLVFRADLSLTTTGRMTADPHHCIRMALSPFGPQSNMVLAGPDLRAMPRSESGTGSDRPGTKGWTRALASRRCHHRRWHFPDIAFAYRPWRCASTDLSGAFV
jgi:hypothetical protein